VEKHFPLEEIEMVGVTYSMGDGIDKITDIRRVKNRGVREEKAGRYVGGGTKVFDEVTSSGMRAVVIPGLHKGVAALDPRFRALYSHCASAEKVSLAYHCYLRLNRERDAHNLIISDISSNTVTIAIKDGRFFGAIDACLGAVGLHHGPLDLEALRKVDSGEITANKAFYSSGAVKISGSSPEDILEGKDAGARLSLEALIMSAKMEALSLLGEIDPDAFVVTGLAGIHKNVFDPLKEALGRFAPVFKINGYAAAMGSAEIARDVLRGRRDFLGIGVKI
jgi:putative methanogenesis marker protein 12